jgi:prolipoprotein diacylglyceryltransferase
MTRTASLDELAFMHWLTEQGYLEPRPINETHYAALFPFMFTHAIITGRIGEKMFYDDRWCYSSLNAAKKALEDWNGVGEPEGWHRHPTTGRRRSELGEEVIP